MERDAPAAVGGAVRTPQIRSATLRRLALVGAALLLNESVGVAPLVGPDPAWATFGSGQGGGAGGAGAGGAGAGSAGGGAAGAGSGAGGAGGGAAGAGGAGG